MSALASACGHAWARGQSQATRVGARPRLIAKRKKWRLLDAYSHRGKHKTMVSGDFPRWSLNSCKHDVNGGRRSFRVLDQGVGRRWRRRRMHRRCIRCAENTRQLPLHEFDRRRRPRTSPWAEAKVHFLVRPGSHFLAPAVRFSTARRARPSQAWPLLQRPPEGLGLDRPSTVLRLQEAVTTIGMVRSEVQRQQGQCPPRRCVTERLQSALDPRRGPASKLRAANLRQDHSCPMV